MTIFALYGMVGYSIGKEQAVHIFVGMKVPRGDPEKERLAELVSQTLRQAGHEVFLAYREIEQRGLVHPTAFMALVREQITAADRVLILYDAELRGGLIELGIAYACGKPVWLAHRAGERVSSSALGCAESVVEYRTLEELAGQLLAL